MGYLFIGGGHIRNTPSLCFLTTLWNMTVEIVNKICKVEFSFALNTFNSLFHESFNQINKHKPMTIRM